MFRWQRENIAIPGATNGTLVVSAVTTNINGAHFRVAVSNATSGRISSNATLRVLPDLSRPVLLSAGGTDSNTITLVFSKPLLATSVTNVTNVRDTSAAHNMIDSRFPVPVSADYFIPMTSAWKYLLTGTNPPVHAAFMQSNYDDSQWAGPSNALLYVEDAALPAPKNTLLSTHDPSDTRFPVFYFRQDWVRLTVGDRVRMEMSPYDLTKGRITYRLR